MDATLGLNQYQNVFRIGGANLGQVLVDTQVQPRTLKLKLNTTGFEALKLLVTEDVMVSELDLTGSTFEADVFSLQQFKNVRTLRLAQCRKLTDGRPSSERHTAGTSQEPQLEVLDLSECPSIKGINEFVPRSYQEILLL